MLRVLHTVVFFTLIFSLDKVHAQMFKEVSNEVGLDYIYPGNDFQMVGGGLMVIDVNNDGWEDFFQSGGVFDSKLWLNNRGKFSDATRDFGLDDLKGYFIQGAFCADFNNDGFQDFFVANYGTGMSRGDKKSPAILKNIEGKRFELISLENVLEPGNFSSACLGDVNKDGFVDIYLTNYVSSMGAKYDSAGVEIGYDPTCYENKLLISDGAMSFHELAQDYSVNDGGCGLSASFTDFDQDGDMDLMLLNDFGEWTGYGNRLFRNEYPKKTFSDVSAEFGFEREMYGMGIGQGDYDEDGDLDYYITNIGRNCLFQNNQNRFAEVAKELNLDNTYAYDSVLGTSWSGLFFDVDFDGDLDVYISKGNVMTLVPKAALSDANKFFLNEEGNFTDVTRESGVGDILSHRGAVIFDYDHDGDLDIISSIVKLPWSVFAKRDQKIKLYENTSKAQNWVGIKLVGADGINRDCFGCSVLFQQGDRKMLTEVDAASGLSSQSSRIMYYGLGKGRKLQKVTVNWIDGTRSQYKRLKRKRIYEIHSSGKIKRVKN
ncbi:MAG: CRTAC1 family protein [Crocinitomicaceae bacterium]